MNPMDELESGHYFSPEEVNVLIPKLEEHFQNFWALRENAQVILQELRKKVPDVREFEPEVLAHQQMRQSQAHFLLEQAKSSLDAIMEMGAVIKDLSIGLVDFPHYSPETEEEVFLCWKYGEKKVRHWHDIDEGFGAPKPLRNKSNPQ